jgi:hypothetical protein
VVTPGEYLHKRRIAMPMTLDDVAEALKGVPLLSAPLAALEDGSAVITLGDAWLLQHAFNFDIQILGAIVVGGLDEAICRICGCTDADPCTLPNGYHCGWHDGDPDLCTACAEGEGL